MFLDPDPKVKKYPYNGGGGTAASRHSGSSGFFSSQRPIESPRDRAVRRKPLHERSQSQNNQQQQQQQTSPAVSPAKTVRLVQPASPARAHLQPSSHRDKRSTPASPYRTNLRKGDFEGDKHASKSSPPLTPTKRATNKDVDESSALKWSSAAETGFARVRAIDPALRVSDDAPAANKAGESEDGPPPAIPAHPEQAHDRGDAGPVGPSIPSSKAQQLRQHRRSGSSGNFSHASTLREKDDEGEGVYFGIATARRLSRFSQGTTLRGTPTPTPCDPEEEQDQAHGFDRPVLLELGSSNATPTSNSRTSFISTHTLQTLRESSPNRSTVRVVLTSEGGETGSTPSPVEPRKEESQLLEYASKDNFDPTDSVDQVAQSSPHSDRPESGELVAEPSSPSDLAPLAEQDDSLSSASDSLPASPGLRDISAVTILRGQRSGESIAQSEATIPPPSSPNIVAFPSDSFFAGSSSPNFVAYYSDSSRPRSRSLPLHAATSIESIQSRLQYSSLAPRPDTGRSIASTVDTNFRPSLDNPTSSTDTLPPLQNPKKRLRHKPGSLSLGSATYAGSSSAAMEEDFDPLPWPRQVFSSHLSTIASESDHSRHASQQLSHFSLGSGVLTADDASTGPVSGSWSRWRRESAPLDSPASPSFPQLVHSSEDEAGDMTLGLYREESAKPPPLFKPTSDTTARTYNGPLPPIPPMPQSRDSDEDFDTVSELQAPPLNQKRSGYSLRARSAGTPSIKRVSVVSCSETYSSHRDSQYNNIFPLWARNFYIHNAPLLSASKISLDSLPPTAQHPHTRNDSQWTERSVTSRLGTGYSDLRSDAGSVNGGSRSSTSSRFLPSIFRPHGQQRSRNDGAHRHKRVTSRKSNCAASSESSRPGITPSQTPQPLPSQQQQQQDIDDDDNGDDANAILPSGQPRYGTLKDSPSPDGHPRRLPRAYSKQKAYDLLSYPRPMTQDRLSDFSLPPVVPHLSTSQRQAHGMSAWRAPSFVESLDLTLLSKRGNRQILLFVLGFPCPLFWFLGAVLPIPLPPYPASRSPSASASASAEMQMLGMQGVPGEKAGDLEAGVFLQQHFQLQADAETRWRDERLWMKARWWRALNRIMSVVGVLVIGAVIALAVVATT